MPDDGTPPPRPGQPRPAVSADKKQRLAEALRANLSRRKAQGRARRGGAEAYTGEKDGDSGQDSS